MASSGDHAEYLAVNVLNEGQIVSYRALSRALKVHSNLAKQMLYDFHRKQNSNKPGTLHATYLISGRKEKAQGANTNGVHSQDGEDTNMRSSPFPSSAVPEPSQDSPMESTWTKLMMLAKEEDLEDAKAQFDELISIHVYSLGPSSVKDLQILTDCNRRIAAAYASEDPIQAWKAYGTIQNANVRRRTARRAAPPPAPSATVSASKAAPKRAVKASEPQGEKAAPAPTEETTKPSNAATAKSTQESDQKSAPSSRRSSVSKPALVKRESSSIFKSFAKTKAPAKKATEADDQPEQALSDDEADEDTMMLDGDSPQESAGKSKKERAEDLRKMMEAEDEPMDDAIENAIDAPPQPAESAVDDSILAEEPVETVTVSDGRRRGRRRVMKKRTVKDDEGYLVTREEAAWESFSEEEPAPKKAKTSAPAPPAKGKKGAKVGQGNIMSFFAKK